jgi:hypothetical protein
VYLPVVVWVLRRWRRGRARVRRGEDSLGGRSAGRYAGVRPLSWAIGNVKQILQDKSPDLKSKVMLKS